MRHRLLTGLTALILLAAVETGVARPFTYVNERFGTSATFPDDVFTKPDDAPANGDGQRWTSADGASIAIYAGYNVSDDTPKTLDAAGRNMDGRTVTYSKAGRNWLVQSGFDEGLVFYERQVISPTGVIHGVLIKYPPRLKDKYDRLVGPIAGSLRGP